MQREEGWPAPIREYSREPSSIQIRAASTRIARARVLGPEEAKGVCVCGAFIVRPNEWMHTRPLKLKLKHHLSNYNRALSDYLLNYSGLWCRSTDSKSAHRQRVALCIRLLSICVVSAQVCAKYVRVDGSIFVTAVSYLPLSVYMGENGKMIEKQAERDRFYSALCGILVNSIRRRW